MPFGLSNTAQSFQRMMDCTTDGLEGVFAYMEKSCVGSPDRQTPSTFGSFFQCPGCVGSTVFRPNSAL
jgi:hypothetical protein